MGSEDKLSVFEVELETLSIQKLERSGLSFSLSLIVHLSIFLFLSFYLVTSKQSPSISLHLDEVEDVGELDEISAIVEFDSSEDFEALEMTEDVVEEELLDLVEQDDTLVPDLLDPSLLEEFSLDDIDEEDPLGQEIAGDGKGKTGEGGSGRSGGFFGIEATGKRVIYLIDMSPSMGAGYGGKRRFDRAVDEVLYSVDKLEPDQEFLVILFCFRMYSMNLDGIGKYSNPTAEKKKALAQWLYNVQLDNGTDPREAIVAAMMKKPTCCFLLSDGEFNGGRYRNPPYIKKATAVVLAKLHNKHDCPINTIGLEDRGNQKALTAIAEDSGGVYKFVPAVNGRKSK